MKALGKKRFAFAKMDASTIPGLKKAVVAIGVSAINL